MNSRLFGQFYAIESEEEAFECDIDDAIVSDKRIAIDWTEGYEKLHAALSSDDGCFYSGTSGSQQNRLVGAMSGWLFKSRSGEYVLWTHWDDSRRGSEGYSLIFLSSE